MVLERGDSTVQWSWKGTSHPLFTGEGDLVLVGTSLCSDGPNLLP